MLPLSGWDSLLLASETPNVHQHTLKVAVVDPTGFEGEPTFEAFRATFADRLTALEPLRYQLVTSPLGLHRPMWRDDAEVDFDYHLRRVRVAAPGGRRQLDDLIGAIASTALDRSRPLRQLYYAEGLADRRIAVIGKVHHVLADGVASANLMALAMKWPGAVPPRHGPSVSTRSTTATDIMRSACCDHLRRIRRLPSAIKDGVAGAYRLERQARRRSSHPELADQFNPPRTFLNHKVSPGRTFASASLSLADVKEISKKLDATINDLVLAVAAGGLRRLFQDYGEAADEPLIASVPAATDISPDRITGNALSTMLVSLPVQVVDPLERLQFVRTSARIAKENHDLLGPTLVGRWLEFVPPVVMRAVFRWSSRREAPNPLFNIIVSNVPGPWEQGCVDGAVATDIYSVAPLATGSALNVTVWSYAGQLNISALSDDTTLRDTHDVTDAFVAAFTELRDAAGIEGTDITSVPPRAW